MTRQPVSATKASVYHDASGRIIAIVVADEQGHGPPGGIAPPPGSHHSEIELTNELAGVPLLELHTRYQVDRKGKTPRLVCKRK